MFLHTILFGPQAGSVYRLLICLILGQISQIWHPRHSTKNIYIFIQVNKILKVGTLSDKGKKNAGKRNINQLTAIKNSLVSVLFYYTYMQQHWFVYCIAFRSCCLDARILQYLGFDSRVTQDQLAENMHSK